MREFRVSLNIKYLIILLIFLLVGQILNPSFLEASWPYTVILILLIVIQYFIQKEGIESRKKAIFIVLILVSSLFGLQFFYYYVLPLHGNYQPITDYSYFRGIGMEDKFYVNYLPDHPDPGSTMLLYVSVCDVSLINCEICSKCIVDGSFYDDGTELPLFQDRSLDKEGKIQFMYPGKNIDVNMRYGDSPKNYKFIVPQPSFLESFYLSYVRIPIMGVLATIMLVSGALGSVYSMYSKRNLILEKLKNLLIWKKRKRQ